MVPPGLQVEELWQALANARVGASDPTEQRRRVGALALRTDSAQTEAERWAVVAERLHPVHTWPDRRLQITAVDAFTGESAIFDSESGVSLVDAVAASCAVPGLWAPVTIGESRYVDGGVRSTTNADLAEGYDRTLVLAPYAPPSLEGELELLRKTSRVELITPDQSTRHALGTNNMNPGTRVPWAEAGITQGRRLATAVSALWVV